MTACAVKTTDIYICIYKYIGIHIVYIYILYIYTIYIIYIYIYIYMYVCMYVCMKPQRFATRVTRHTYYSNVHVKVIASRQIV